MKSSVRILAIALALAFLLLARTAFQDSPTSASEHIDLKDGEASFADPINGMNEAEYLGFGDTATKTVYFYIKSEDLNTQMTAMVEDTGTDTGEGATGLISRTGNALTLQGATNRPGAVRPIPDTHPGAADVPTTPANFLDIIDAAYCQTMDGVAVIDRTTGGTPFEEPGAGNENATTSVAVPTGWALYVDGSATSTCASFTGGLADPGLTASTTLRESLAKAERDKIVEAELIRSKARNAAVYMYGSDGTTEAAKINPMRRYTRGTSLSPVDFTGTPDIAIEQVGGANWPVVGTAKVTEIEGGAATTTRDLPNAVTSGGATSDDGDHTGGTITSLLTIPTLGDAGEDTLRVRFTYDVVDEYAASDDTASGADYKAYLSGYARAYVSSGSDSGQWVTISEVASVSMMHDAAGAPATNLFRGMVTITNDTDFENDETIYAQDGDTITLQVFDENGNRSSDVLATATALIDDSPPTISNLSPADESIINDDELRISFTVNDDGAGSDFRNIEEVVKMVQVQARADSGDEPRGMGDPCTVAIGDQEIDNAGGNASSVGVLVAPANKKFTTGCGDIVKTGNYGKFNLIITAQDLAGNLTTHTTQLTIDKAKPVVQGVPGVGQAWDEDKNAPKTSANSILIEFSEALDVDTVAASDFTVAGYTVDSAEVVGTNDEDNKNLNKFVVLTLTEDLANDARPSVTVTGVNDVAGNTIEQATRTSNNKIKAVVTVVPFSALIAEDGEQAISFTSDEALRSMGGGNSTKASVNGANLSVKVSDDTMGGSATFKQSAFSDSGTYGVMIQAVDIDTNVTRVGAVKVSREDVSDDIPDNGFGAAQSVVVTPAKWPPADTDLDGDLEDEFKLYVGGADDATHSVATDVDTDTGKVTFASVGGNGIAASGRIEIDYSYVKADQVIQVDVDAPMMTSIPEDNSETDNASRAIQFIWTEDKEYAGDSYKTVTLNSAMHEGPSGTSTDILDALTTHDNKTWVYTPATDLALGDHEFTVKATDAAGNSATETITITITERKPIEIGLRVGWNLISFPGTPKSTDVNDVFTSDTISVVSQYDARRVSPFTVWTRGEDGSLSSSPAGRTSIDSGLGLWVLSSDGSPLEVVTTPDDVTQVPPSIDLIPGWNLVAVILVSESEVGVNEYLPQGAWSRAFRLNNLTGRFESFTPPAADVTDVPGVALKAGDALWVYATEAATIVPK